MSEKLARQLEDWDPREVTPRYWRALESQANVGSFDPDGLDALLTAMVLELRGAYSGKDLERALNGSSSVLAHYDTYASQVRYDATGTFEPSAGQHTIAQVLAFAARQRAEARKGSQPKQPEQIPDPVAEAQMIYAPAPAVADELPPIAQALAEPANSSLPEARLNGRRLGKSIMPTWLALVVLSWISLLWGGLVSAPIGVGGLVLGGAFAGVVAVPLWATIFGFWGMGGARDSTLKELGFQPCGPDDALQIAAAKFSTALDIPTPTVGRIDIFNALAMGSNVNSATVAMGAPLMDALTEAETEAVLAHELGHVVSGDMRRMMLMRTFQNATVWFMIAQGMKQFARWVICWAAELYILAFSRKREYWADAIGAALAGKEAMIGALRKLGQGPALSDAENTHSRFMLRGRVSGMFSTHPSIEERIAALEAETYLRQLPRQAG